MSFTVDESLESRTGNEDLRDLIYIARGGAGDDEDGAVTAVLAVAPATRNGLPQNGVSSIRPLQNSEYSYEVRVHYGNDSPNFGGTATDIGTAVLLSFSTTGGSQHITQSKGTQLSVSTAAGTSPPDFKGAIGVGQNGDVAGVDTPIPVFNFSVRKRFAKEDFTLTLIYDLYKLTGSQNESNWSVTVNLATTSESRQLQFSAWEVQYLGVDAPEPSPDGSVTITYRFAASPNLINYTIPNSGLQPITFKGGWDYLWVYYMQSTSDDGKYLVQKPIGAYVEEVLNRGDFTKLKLPA